MKRRFVIIMLLTVTLLMSGCGELMGNNIKLIEDRGMIYEGNRYHFYLLDSSFDRPKTEFFHVNDDDPEFAGTFVWWYLLPRKAKTYYSQFDAEKNILYANTTGYRTWIKEGFEFPNGFECRINKIITFIYTENARVSGEELVLWEAENEFITLNDMIEKEIEPFEPEMFKNSDKISLFCDLEDYKYLYLTFMNAFIYNDDVYFRINGYYHTIKNEYKTMFKDAIELDVSNRPQASATPE